MSATVSLRSPRRAPLSHLAGGCSLRTSTPASGLRFQDSAYALTGREHRSRYSREVDGEDTSDVRKAPRIDPAVVRLDAPPAVGEAKAQAGSIGASLLERVKQL